MATIVVVGNLTKDSELKTRNDGSKYLSFSVAENYGKRDADGNQSVQFFNCQIWGSRGEKLSEFLNKGQKVVVHGTLTTAKNRDNDGMSMFIAVNEINLVGGGQESSAKKSKPAPKQEQEADFDDDIPF